MAESPFLPEIEAALNARATSSEVALKATKDVAAVSADASDLASAITLVNELKGIINNMNA